MFIIKLNQGDYCEDRGGFDWGRCGHWTLATQFDTRAEAEDYIKTRGLASHGGRVENVNDVAREADRLLGL